MLLHNLFSKLGLTAFVGSLFPGYLALAASDLQTSLETLSLPNNDIAFLQQVTTGMSMIFDSAQENYAEYFPRGHFYRSQPALDETSLAYIYAHRDYLRNVTILGPTFDLSDCELPPDSLSTLQNWSVDTKVPTLTFVRTVLHAERLRAQRCAMSISRVIWKYFDLEDLQLKLWNMPLYRHDLTSSFSCPTLKPLPKHGKRKYIVYEALEIKFSDALDQAALFICQDIKQSLTVFQRDMKLLVRKSWAAHIWRDSVLNYHQRITRLRLAQLEVSRAASLVVGMDDKALEKNLPALTEYCKALRDMAMGSSTPSLEYTISNWAADHISKWTA